MRSIKIGIGLLALAFCITSPQRAEAQPRVANSVFGNGGAVISGGGFRLIGTVGQPIIGVVSNAANINKVGFWYQSGGFITSVEKITDSNLPKEYRLEQNYPNPFNPATTIRFALPKRSPVTLMLFDVLGREVATLVDEELQPGEYKVVFDASGLSPGVYLYRLQAEGFSRTKKLTLMK
ncbi:MAG: T9SS type A sorting domain-containing protein [candidate division KSB1 bacterium]|nr:T9SS type A sorting domain-containing protein [candidate division KSB1 bacterium]MDZ7302355.1 T9SS type A sorting domain-containing protein [candidate division KSB1 bacterium]MDZ7311207.1 T9SS type A sorting domain-containing protein [candidate division KSB1 bacterium]